MTVFGLTILIAQIALCLAMFRVNPLFGVGMVIASLVATGRAASVAHYHASMDEPLSRSGYLLLVATSTNVVCLVLIWCGVAVVGPFCAVATVFSFLGLEDLQGTTPSVKLIEAGMVVLLLGSMVLGCFLAAYITPAVASHVAAVAPNWRVGCRPFGWLGLVAVLMTVIGVSVSGPMTARGNQRRIDRVARAESEARAQQANRLGCVRHREADPAYCALCAGIALPTLQLEAVQFERTAVAEQQRAAELRAEIAQAQRDQLLPTWAALVAVLVLAALGVRAVRFLLTGQDEDPFEGS